VRSPATIGKRIAGALRAAALGALVRDRNGNVASETALAALPLLLFLLAIINAGYALWLQNALDASVIAAARCASVNPSLCGNASQIKAYAAGRAGAGFDSSIFSVAQTSCGNQVSATYPLSLTPPFASYSLNLRAQACYPI
jgi:Flp pilus assembly protein TadG